MPGAALAQATATRRTRSPRPKGWNYEIKDGKRVPKGNRVTNADGSWREEVRQGSCVTVKEKTANGEYKETPPLRLAGGSGFGRLRDRASR